MHLIMSVDRLAELQEGEILVAPGRRFCSVQICEGITNEIVGAYIGERGRD